MPGTLSLEIEVETEIEGDRASGPKFETETEIEAYSGEAAVGILTTLHK